MINSTIGIGIVTDPIPVTEKAPLRFQFVANIMFVYMRIHNGGVPCWGVAVTIDLVLQYLSSKSKISRPHDTVTGPMDSKRRSGRKRGLA